MVTASPSTRVSSLYGRMPFCVCLSVSQSVEKTATLMRRAPATVTGFEENDLRDNDGKLMEWGEEQVMCVCIHVCMYALMCVCIHVCMHAVMCVCLHVCMYAV